MNRRGRRPKTLTQRIMEALEECDCWYLEDLLEEIRSKRQAYYTNPQDLHIALTEMYINGTVEVKDGIVQLLEAV